jgi:hypothetical protein
MESPGVTRASDTKVPKRTTLGALLSGPAAPSRYALMSPSNDAHQFARFRAASERKVAGFARNHVPKVGPYLSDGTAPWWGSTRRSLLVTAGSAPIRAGHPGSACSSLLCAVGPGSQDAAEKSGRP